ncbi:MAG: HAD-IA family hydrolase [Mariprofundaceae bacterium]|nr:HAD-IA family hydrolase [Mariprofundaceae bacterium]
MNNNISNIKMVVFDLFGVLITEGHMISNVLMPLLPENTSKTVVKSFYNPYTRGEIDEHAFWHGIGQHDNAPLRAKFLNSFILDAQFNSSIQTLSATYQLAILSNLGSAWAENLSHQFNFKAHFKPIMFSGDVGCEKPQPRIYEMFIQQSQLQAEEIIFIDDRLENLQAAHQFGIKTIHFQREEQTADFQAGYTIHQLSEVVDLLCPNPHQVAAQSTQNTL